MKHLVLSGGGTKGIAMMGSLTYLYDKGLLADIETYTGTSIGAVVAAALALGIHPRDLFEQHVVRHTYEPSIDISGLDTAFGLDDGRGLLAWLCRFVPPGITFEDLFKKTRQTLVVVVTNMNTRRAEYWSHETVPTMEVVHALRVSCTVPLYFTAVPHQGMLYVDGCVVDNFAVQHALDRDRGHVLGICFKRKPKASSAQWTLESFLGALLEATLSAEVQSRRARVIELDVGFSTNPLNFNMSPEKRTNMFVKGYRDTRFFIEKKTV